MTYSVELSQFAVDDLRDILDWYKDQREGLDQEFTTALDDALKQIETNPFAFQAKIKKSRHIILQRFPYKVVFSVIENKIKVVGIIHHARSPKLIRKRLK